MERVTERGETFGWILLAAAGLVAGAFSVWPSRDHEENREPAPWVDVGIGAGNDRNDGGAGDQPPCGVRGAERAEHLERPGQAPEADERTDAGDDPDVTGDRPPHGVRGAERAEYLEGPEQAPEGDVCMGVGDDPDVTGDRPPHGVRGADRVEYLEGRMQSMEEQLGLVLDAMDMQQRLLLNLRAEQQSQGVGPAQSAPRVNPPRLRPQLPPRSQATRRLS